MAKAKKTKKVASTKAKSAKKTKAVVKKAKPAKKVVAAKAKTPAKKPAASKKSPSVAKKPVMQAAPAQKGSKSTSMKSVAHLVSPLDDRVLVRLTSAERTTASGLIIIPDTAAVSGNMKGDVVAVGRGHLDSKGRLRPVELKLGDRVLFDQYAGAKVTLMQEELVILRESEILGVLET